MWYFVRFVTKKTEHKYLWSKKILTPNLDKKMQGKIYWQMKTDGILSEKIQRNEIWKICNLLSPPEDRASGESPLLRVFVLPCLRLLGMLSCSSAKKIKHCPSSLRLQCLHVCLECVCVSGNACVCHSVCDQPLKHRKNTGWCLSVSWSVCWCVCVCLCVWMITDPWQNQL